MNNGLDEVFQSVLNCEAPDLQELVLDSLKPFINFSKDKKLTFID